MRTLCWLIFLNWCLILSQSIAQSPGDVAMGDWMQVTPQAEWRARDSSGELVLGGRMWLLGGWFDSFASPPRDVWSSTDGKSWQRVIHEAPWLYSDLPMTINFRDRMWIMGGWTEGRLAGHGATSQVWSSSDGRDWKLEAQRAGWSPRLAAGLVEFKGRLWILGGTENYYFGDKQSVRNDVWSSSDGVHWQQEIEHAPWSARAYHQAVALGDRLWVMGGGNYVPEYHAENDVWSSTDGIHWEQAAEHAPWSPRLWFSAVAYRNRMWVMGGWSNNPSKNWDDVWHSTDGKQWQQLKTEHSWKARHEHSSYVFQDQIYVAGGHAQPLNSEVWTLKLPRDF